jgi:protein-L-isoaspartate(D-aspartate) O-methyltransferase
MIKWGRKKVDDYARLRGRMVKEQVLERGVSDPAVLNALRKVERHLFVPEELRDFAYEDRPLPIGHQQTISQPYIVAYMTEAVHIRKTDKVLEVGTGSGYQAAILAEMASEVYTLEVVKAFAAESSRRLKELGYSNVFVKYSDGYRGWEEQAPFDVIVVTAAPRDIPEELLRQLKAGGRMIIPIGSLEQDLYRIVKQDGEIVEERLCAVRFVPMVKGE